MDLDEMLGAANPSTVERSQALLEDLSGLALEARATRRGKRRAVRWTIAGVASAAVFGVGSAAVAAGLLPFGWTSKQGGHCMITSATVQIAGIATSNEAAFASTTPKQRQETLHEASRYLAGYDYKAIDIAAAVATWRRAEAVAIAGQPNPAEKQPRLEGDELESQSIIHRVELDLDAHLTNLGLNPQVLTPDFGYTGRVGTDGVFRCDG